VLKPRSSDVVAILGDTGKFQRWELAERNRSLGMGPWRNLVLDPFLFLSVFCLKR
jgi:hypothetical protein